MIKDESRNPLAANGIDSVSRRRAGQRKIRRAMEHDFNEPLGHHRELGRQLVPLPDPVARNHQGFPDANPKDRLGRWRGHLQQPGRLVPGDQSHAVGQSGHGRRVSVPDEVLHAEGSVRRVSLLKLETRIDKTPTLAGKRL